MHGAYGAGRPLAPWLGGIPDVLQRNDYGGTYSGPYNSTALGAAGPYLNGYSGSVGSAASQVRGAALNRALGHRALGGSYPQEVAVPGWDPPSGAYPGFKASGAQGLPLRSGGPC